jgi:hypothetical protein
MTEEQIAKLWVESTQSIWPKNGKFTAGSTNQNLLDFAESVLNAKQQELRERIAISQLAALTSVYWEDATTNSYTTGDALIKCHCETAVEYADALIKELSKGTNE